LVVHYDNKNQGFSKLSITNKIIDWVNTFVTPDDNIYIDSTLLF
jgi:hypothetical protein